MRFGSVNDTKTSRFSGLETNYLHSPSSAISAAAKRAFDAMMTMKKIDVATIEKARRR